MRMLKFLLLSAVYTAAWAGDTPKAGYIDCSMGDQHRLIPVFSNPCISQPVENLSCGERVDVLGREGPWLKLASADGGARYIGAASVSQKKDRFVALDLPVPTGQYLLDCSEFRSKTGKVRPRAIYSPNPEYADEARRRKVQGAVMLTVTIGTDGRSHDIKVSKSLEHGLDAKAEQAVQQWLWEPALDEGKPVESRVYVQVYFRIFK